MKLTKSDAEMREEGKNEKFLFFFFFALELVFFSLFIKQNGTYMYTKGNIFTVQR